MCVQVRTRYLQTGVKFSRRALLETNERASMASNSDQAPLGRHVVSRIEPLRRCWGLVLLHAACLPTYVYLPPSRHMSAVYFLGMV